MKQDYRILPCGDSAVTVEFSNEISPESNEKVLALAAGLEKMQISGLEDMIPTYRSLTLCFDPCRITERQLQKYIRKAAKRKDGGEGRTRRLFSIPVAYGSEFGPDLERVASHAGLEPIEVVRLHVSRIYPICMIGFLPGFPYLSGMDERLETPRLEDPRTVIPAGSVGIGGKQTGIYPLESPGGWNLIGRTPVKPYDPDRNPPVIYRSGDSIRFVPVRRQEYEQIRRETEAGTYSIAWEEY